MDVMDIMDDMDTTDETEPVLSFKVFILTPVS